MLASFHFYLECSYCRTMTPPAADTATPDTTDSSALGTEPDLVAEDLIEEVSIDGMCGVY